MPELTVQEIKDMMAETAKAQKEARIEAERRGREIDLRMEKDRQEAKRRGKELDRRMKETDRRLKKLDELFTSQWGKLIESLVEGDLVKLLKMRGITVDKTLVRREYIEVPGKPLAEFDLIACNGNETVVIEVKTTLRVEDVDHFLKSMKLFRTAMPRFQNDIIYGGVAYINVVGSADKYAQKKKIFAIKATGSSASIINAEDFEPQTF